MGFLEPILNVPYAYIWLPITVFLCVVGAFYWLSRPLPKFSSAAPAKTEAESAPVLVAEKAKEQRFGFRRHGNPVEVLVTPPEDHSNPRIGSVLDRSVGGMRLALYHEVDLGTVLAIRPVHADAMVPWVELEIRSCRPSTEMPGQFEIGCQYVKSPPYSIQLLFG